MSLILVFTEGLLARQKNPRVAIYEESDGETFLDTKDLQSELYTIEERDFR